MATDTDIIQRIVGVRGRPAMLRKQPRSAAELTKIYDVELPQREYRPFPPVWTMIVYNPLPDEQIDVPRALRELRAQIDEFLKSAGDDTRTPILVISTSRRVKLADNLGYEKRNVFFLEALDFENHNDESEDKRYSLLVMSARKRLTSREIAKRLLRPYTTGKPARGWRFFGRIREIESITSSDENIYICGARKIGKTSLLRALERHFTSEGYATYFVSLENIITMQEVAVQIIGTMSERERYRAANRSDMLNEPYLESVLRSLVRSSQKPIVLLLDEFGNVVEKNRQDDWRVVGLLRKFSQAYEGRFRIIMSGFQEFAVKQFEDFSGPYVNFASLVRLTGFSNAEIRDLIIEPLAFWGARVSDPDRAAAKAAAAIGRHPMLLQYLGSVLFERLIAREEAELDQLISYYSEAGTRLDAFNAPVRAMWDTMRSPSQRYLFARACHEAYLRGSELSTTVITDDWIKTVLTELGHKSTFDGRRLILEELELHGFTMAGSRKMTSQVICAPIVFRWLAKFEDIPGLLSALSAEIPNEVTRLNWS